MVIDNNDIPKQDYMVLCSTITYNQAPYITDTMNGFCMQQTSFSYACYIIDDASTDGEQDVIKAYLDEHFQMDKAEQYELELANVIVAKHNTNPNCTFAVYLLKRNLWKEPDLKRPLCRPWTQRCKYIALCEGDDYWIDPHKLQKQVDFLDANPDYSLCFHKVNIESDFYKEQKLFSHLEERAYSDREIYERWTIPTCSVMYRYLSAVHRKCVSPMVYGDIHLFLSLAQKGRIYCLACVGATYRRHEGSITQHMSSKTIIALLQQYKSMETIFPNLIDITKQYERVYLDRLFYFQKEVKDVWKYRLWYCRLNPKLFMHPFFVITIYKYMLLPYIRKVFK